MSKKIRAISDWWGDVFIEKIAVPLGVALFLGGTGLAMVEVFRRYVIGSSFIWQQDIVVVALLSGVSLYFIVAQWRHAHIAVTALEEYVLRQRTPKRVRGMQIMHSVANAWTGVFVFMLLYWGFPLIWQYQKLGIRLQSQTIPFWPFFMVFVLALAPLAFTYLLHALQGFRSEEMGGGLDLDLFNEKEPSDEK